MKHQSFVYTQLNDQTVLFLTIQFSISHLCAQSLNDEQFYLTYRILPGATTPGQSGPGSDGNEGVFCIPQSSSITWHSQSDWFLSYPGHLLVEVVVESYPCAQMQSVYSTTLAEWAVEFLELVWDGVWIGYSCILYHCDKSTLFWVTVCCSSRLTDFFPVTFSQVFASMFANFYDCDKRHREYDWTFVSFKEKLQNPKSFKKIIWKKT